MDRFCTRLLYFSVWPDRECNEAKVAVYAAAVTPETYLRESCQCRYIGNFLA